MIVTVACAAVLLTSFKEVALLAVEISRVSVTPQAAPHPDQTEELSRFPDLLPSRSDREKLDTDELDGKLVQGDVAGPSLPVCREVTGLDDLLATTSAGLRPLRTLICVWRI